MVLMAGALLAPAGPPPPADLLLVNGRVYSFTWADPRPDGMPAGDAPRTAAGWRPDAEAIGVRDGRIVFVGMMAGAQAHRGPRTRVLDVAGATVLPGLVDSHTHVAGLGERLTGVDLIGVENEAKAVARVAAFAANVPRGEWILGRGWDEGLWASRYPDLKLLSEKVPDHPVVLVGLHSFAVWGNRLALERAGIVRDTRAPEGGEILRDGAGEPTGVLLNRATSLLTSAVPPPTDAQLEEHVRLGLESMARAGYVAVHEAGADTRLLRAFAALEEKGRLPVRVYAMLSVRDPALCRFWLARGPDTSGRLQVRSAKAYYDGALGSRGALLLESYSDREGHRGVGGADYGFDAGLVADLAKGGFQLAIHSIGDAANREALDVIGRVYEQQPAARELRHRIEHAQVLDRADIPRFARLEVVASMQPPHAVEDKAWAEARVGPRRIEGAYAWRSLRRAGARLIFNSDLVGSDHDIFYGLHAAITRRDKDRQPPAGWYPAERLTPEEALRAYTTWAAYAAFWEKETGVLAPGRWADLTVLDLDPLVVGETDPGRLLRGRVLATIVEGRLIHDALAHRPP
jgi:predicted amidohydrolase YtcJ